MEKAKIAVQKTIAQQSDATGADQIDWYEDWYTEQYGEMVSEFVLFIFFLSHSSLFITPTPHFSFKAIDV